MSKKLDKILELVKELTPAERTAVMEALQSSTGTNYVGMLNLRCQELYKAPIAKRTWVTPPFVHCSIKVPFGVFEAVGINKKEAGEKAAYEALLKLSKIKF